MIKRLLFLKIRISILKNDLSERKVKLISSTLHLITILNQFFQLFAVRRLINDSLMEMIYERFECTRKESDKKHLFEIETFEFYFDAQVNFNGVKN